MEKPDKNVEDAQGSTLSFRHKLILARDGRALAANQAPGNEPKTELFDLREMYQDELHLCE